MLRGAWRVAYDMQDFRQIRAWQRAHAMSIALHKTSRGFGAGYAALRAQLTRSASSISANIVEGCGAATQKEFARFLDIAIKSANETEHHLIEARDLELIAPDSWQRLNAETVEIRKMLYAYRRKILESIAEPI